MAEQLIKADGVELCVETFGESEDPPVLLVMGTGASMLWWEEGFCRMLADGGRHVVRYDHRDTGRSTTNPVGRPDYTGADLTDDAFRVLGGLDIEAAHVVGVSAGGGCAQELALDRPERVRSLVLISTSPATSGARDLPPPAPAFGEFLSQAPPDWSDRDSILTYIVGYQRMLAGTERPFDEVEFRDLVSHDIDRANDYAAIQNHDVLPQGDRDYGSISAITAPTLVVHGTADPMFPVEHGEALSEAIPGARLLILDGAGHGVFRPDWKTLVTAILEHTS